MVGKQIQSLPKSISLGIAKYDSIYDHKLLHRTLSDEIAKIVSASSKSQTLTNFRTADLSKSIVYGFQKLKKYQKSKNENTPKFRYLK